MSRIRGINPATHRRFFVILDEAHRGTKLEKGKAEEANSIMQKFLLGSDEIPATPLVIGI